jgi:hypothetical protein
MVTRITQPNNFCLFKTDHLPLGCHIAWPGALILRSEGVLIRHE